MAHPRRFRLKYYWKKVPERLARSLVRRGAFGSLVWLLRRIPHLLWYYLTPAGRLRARRLRSFDSEFDIETQGGVGLSELEISSPNIAYGVEYGPVDAHEFLDLLRKLKIDYRDFVFVDLGAGKGRALLVAAQFPFKKVIGVEFSAVLVRIAWENVAKYLRSTPPCQHIEVLCRDVVEYVLPNGNAVISLYNPFGEPVMEEVLRNLESSLRSDPREIYIIYVNPVLAKLFDCQPWLQKIDSSEDIELWQPYAIYKYRPEALGKKLDGGRPSA